jgi:DDB1- and CUL4-associated factor 8
MQCSGKQKLRYNSGHRNNVFQARALPGSNDATIVSCAADGQVSSKHAIE